MAANSTENKTPSMARLWLLRLLAFAAMILALNLLQGVLRARVNDYVFDIIMLAGINIILAVSLNLINGITGQFSLGHAGFMALGAFSSAAFTKYAGPRLDLPFWAIFMLSLLPAIGVAGVAGWFVGLPSLRLRGDYLAIVTLGFGQIITAIIVTIEELGGSLGLDDTPALRTGAPDFAFQKGVETNFVWLFAFVVLCIVCVRNLADSKLGRDMRAIRDDEVAAEAVGVNTTKVKVLAFVVSAMWGGLAGALYVHYNHTANVADYDFTRSVMIVVMVVLGGLGSISGAVLAAVLLQIMDAALRSVNGVFIVCLCLAILLTWLEWSSRHSHKSTLIGVLSKVRWTFAPLIAFATLAIFWLFGRGWIESKDTPGKAEDWLRFVLYALILIALMLMRPQGLLGRSEFHLRWLRRKNTQDLEGAKVLT
jgi:branched-chain amino acid transport system permease protein